MMLPWWTITITHSRFTKDAQLIASLTAHSDEVPLISGFETEMLMQANRKPFFYYFPLFISRPDDHAFF